MPVQASTNIALALPGRHRLSESGYQTSHPYRVGKSKQKGFAGYPSVHLSSTMLRKVACSFRKTSTAVGSNWLPTTR